MLLKGQMFTMFNVLEAEVNKFIPGTNVTNINESYLYSAEIQLFFSV